MVTFPSSSGKAERKLGWRVRLLRALVTACCSNSGERWVYPVWESRLRHASIVCGQLHDVLASSMAVMKSRKSRHRVLRSSGLNVIGEKDQALQVDGDGK